MSLSPCGYRPCKDQDKIVAALAYEAERDELNPSSSVFCSHGAGVNISWDKVGEYMHLESCLKPKNEAPEPVARPRYRPISIDEKELEAIMEREFGPIRRREYKEKQLNAAPVAAVQPKLPDYVIVDGYNFIFADTELKALAADRLDLARSQLMDMLSNYAGFTKARVTLVYDGFRTPGNPGSKSQYHNINVAFTKDGETADAYIERIVNDIGRNYSVRVVTGDNLIRLSALRSGVLRSSCKEFMNELDFVQKQIDEFLQRSNQGAHKTRLIDGKQ